jgi:hypothetical protein
MPPVAITVMYAAAKGISRSRELALSLAFIDGVIMNTIMMNKGIGTKKIRKVNLNRYSRIRAATDTGIVRTAQRNIKVT